MGRMQGLVQFHSDNYVIDSEKAGRKGELMKVPKKYWWVIGIAVPIIVAVIGIMPQLIPKDGGGGTFYVEVVGTQFNGKVAFNNVTIVAEQTRGQLGTELPKEVVETLRKALELAQAKNFNEAIPAFESVAKVAPVPAVFNNLGAAYLATGNKEKAIAAFENAPDQETARFNLRQTDHVATTTKPVTDEAQEKIGAEVEPNNEILNPNIIPLETWIEAAIAEREDTDYFRFTTPPVYRDIIQVSIENRSTTLRPALLIFNSEKSAIIYRQVRETAGANLHDSGPAGPNETYYVQVTSRYGDTSGNYKVIIRPLRAYDDYEPNDDILNAKLIPIGKSIDAGMMDPLDSDYYQFETSSRAGTITIFIKNRSTTLKPALRVFNNEKSDISDRQVKKTAGANLQHSFSAGPNETYYVQVTSYFGETSGNYSLTVKEEAK